MVKNLEDIRWTEIPTPDRGPQLACSTGDAEKYMDLSKSGLSLVLNEHQVRRYKSGHGRTTYVLKIDLERVEQLRNQVRIEDGSPVSQRQLLEQAAALLEQVTSGQTDASAIVMWLELYQQNKE